jgi:hypothetical protein
MRNKNAELGTQEGWGERLLNKSRLTLVWSLYLTSSQVGSHRPLSFLSVRLSPVPPAFGFVVGHNNLNWNCLQPGNWVFRFWTVLWFLCAVTLNCWLCCQNLLLFCRQFLKVFESESFYNSRVGGWEISLTAQRFDPPALKISPSGREDKDPIAGLGAPTPHYSKEEGKKV